MDEATERMMMQIEAIRYDMQQYQQQKSQMMMSIQEMASAKSTIEALKTAKKDSEIVIPIGGGIFLKGKVIDPSTVIASVGADVAVTKDLDGTVALIEERIKMIDESMKKLDDMMAELDVQAQNIYAALEKENAPKPDSTNQQKK